MNLEKDPTSRTLNLGSNIGFVAAGSITFLTVLPIIGLVGYYYCAGFARHQLGIPQCHAHQWHALRGYSAGHYRYSLAHPGYSHLFCPTWVGAVFTLQEYAPDNNVTPPHRIAIRQPGRYSFSRLWPVRAWLFGYLPQIWNQHPFGKLTLSIMTLPVISQHHRDALRGRAQFFPRGFPISWEPVAGRPCGASPCPRRCPASSPGIILGLERAAGETAPILFTGATFFLPMLPSSIFDATMALPYHIFVISTQVPGMPIKIQYGTVLVLLFFVLGMNIVATLIRSRARARKQW